MRLHVQVFRQLKSQRISKQPGRNKLMNQQFQFGYGAIVIFALASFLVAREIV